MMHKPSEADILKVAKEVAEQVYGMISLPYTANDLQFLQRFAAAMYAAGAEWKAGLAGGESASERPEGVMLNELLAVNNAMIVEVRREDGSIVERYAGPSEEQLKYEHDAGKCGAMCGYCYHEAYEWLAANAIELTGAPSPRPSETE